MPYRYFEVVMQAEALHDEIDISVWYVRSCHDPSPAEALNALRTHYPEDVTCFARVVDIEEVDEEEAAANTLCPLGLFPTI